MSDLCPRCPHCRCSTFAKVDEPTLDGGWDNTKMIRCVECKRIYAALSTPAEVRPFVHVDDLNDPILAALANPEPGQCDYCLERDGKHVADCEEAAPAEESQAADKIRKSPLGAYLLAEIEAEESSVGAHRLLENGSCTGCERCKRGEIGGCDDGSWVELGASAGGAHRLGMWGWIELIFHDADGSESRREYVATDPPTEIGSQPADEGVGLTIEEALQESAYLAGLKAGWNFAITNDEAGYAAAVEGRSGYLKPITAARRATPAEARSDKPEAEA